MRSILTCIIGFLAASVSCFMSDDISLLDNGAIQENNQTHAHLLLQRMYANDSVSPQPESTFSYTYGGVYWVGYYSYFGGSDKVKQAINDCRGLNGVADGFDCGNSVLAAITANVGAAFIGGTYGVGHMAYVASKARSAVGFNPGSGGGGGGGTKRVKARSAPAAAASHPAGASPSPGASPACEPPYAITTNGYFPGGNVGVKLSGTSGCTAYSQSYIDDMAHISGNILSNMYNNEVWQMQGSFFVKGPSGEGIILMRTAYYILGQAPNPCPNVVTGSGCQF